MNDKSNAIRRFSPRRQRLDTSFLSARLEKAGCPILAAAGLIVERRAVLAVQVFDPPLLVIAIPNACVAARGEGVFERQFAIGVSADDDVRTFQREDGHAVVGVMNVQLSQWTLLFAASWVTIV